LVRRSTFPNLSWKIQQSPDTARLPPDMPSKKLTVPDQRIDHLIREIRGQKVILDSDLARVYGVPTFRFNEAVKRNRNRFPRDFMFQLTLRSIGL
jgi:hypothetical protein